MLCYVKWIWSVSEHWTKQKAKTLSIKSCRLANSVRHSPPHVWWKILSFLYANLLMTGFSPHTTVLWVQPASLVHWATRRHSTHHRQHLSSCLSLWTPFLASSVLIVLVFWKKPSVCYFSTCLGIWESFSSVFTARCYASAVLAMGLCLSVSVSVCHKSEFTKMAKRKITQTTLHDNPGTLVFWCQRSPRNSTGVTPYRGTKCRWGGSKSATFHK